MKKVAALSLGLVAALLLTVGFADATDSVDGGAGKECKQDVGVQYSWWGEDGELLIAGDPGSPFEVYDAAGVDVARGIVDAPIVTVAVPNVGFGPDGVIVRVSIGGELIDVDDPDWEWH